MPVDACSSFFRFIQHDADKPWFEAQRSPVEKNLFFEVEEHEVVVSDLRSTSFRPSLEDNGFRLLHAPSSVADLQDDALVDEVYLPEVEALLRRELGASRVVAFDATRRSDAPSGAGNKDGSRKPAGIVHVDYTQKSGRVRAADVPGRRLRSVPP